MRSKLKDWIRLLESIDFGLASMSERAEDSMLRVLEHVSEEMSDLGFDTSKIDLAIRTFRTSPEESRGYLFGPANTGNGAGVIDDLKKSLHSSVIYMGHLYSPVD